MDGLINFYKPPGVSSAKALYRVRKITGVRKSGHAGTLDPAADGVLVLCLGRATKLVERLMDQPKVYQATARLDATSESFDSDRPLIAVPVSHPPAPRAVLEACRSLEGVIAQVPPAVSAVKVGGRPAYRLRRAGHVPSLRARRVCVYWWHVHAYHWPTLEFELACGRGTYVRALIRDLGQLLGTGGCLTALTRKAVGPFRLEEAWSIERLQGARPEAYLLPLDNARAILESASGSIPPRPVEKG